MRVLLVLIAVIISTRAQSLSMISKDDPELLKAAQDCGLETEVDITVFDPDKEADVKLFDDHKYRCFSRCMATKAGLALENGEPNVEKIKETFGFKDDDKVMDHLKACLEENNVDDVCDKVYGVQKCVMEKLSSGPEKAEATTAD